MTRWTAISVFALWVLLGGCSADSVRRASYESMQGLGRLQCEKDFTSDCSEPPSYDEYQISREQAVKGERQP